MRRCFIIARSPQTCASLNLVWTLVDPFIAENYERANSNREGEGTPALPVSSAVLASHDLSTVEIFANLAPRLGSWANDLRNGERGVVLVDLVKVNEFDPLNPNGWSGAIAMLVLSFPEVHWCFGHINEGSDEREQNGNSALRNVMAKYHSPASLLTSNKDPLFDPSGLSNLLRKRIREAKSRSEKEGEQGQLIASYVPLREEFSASLDDERTYAYFHAYAAYRNGFRSLPITTNTEAEEVFGKDANGRTLPAPEGLRLLFEDLFLSFPDINNRHYSDLGGDRKTHLPGLENSPLRVFVTTGQHHTGDKDKRERNEQYVEKLRDGSVPDRWGTQVLKPVAGLFDLWQRSGLIDRLPRSRHGRACARKRGQADGYIWPPESPPEEDGAAHAGDIGHSSPGKLLLIAEVLLERAKTLLTEDSHSVVNAVRGATLATNALELLGYRNPTTSVEALMLKHQFEVIAECQFAGVQYQIEVRRRMAEIRCEARAASRWFDEDKRREALRNTEMIILNRLIRVFREFNQFDEEDRCIARERVLHHALWRWETGTRCRYRYRYRLLLTPVHWYTDCLLRSGGWFVAAIVIWLLLLGGLYTAANTAIPVLVAVGFEPETGFRADYLSGIAEAVSLFTGTDVDSPFAWKVALQIGTAFLGISHLGLFVSRLYSKMARR